MKHTKAAAAIAIAAGAMSAGVAHAVGGPDHPTGNQGQHGQSGQHGNTVTQHGNNGNNGTHGPKSDHVRHNSSSQSQGCHYRNVGFVAKGILESALPTFDSLGGGKFDLQDMSLTFNGGNRFGRHWNTLSSPFSLSNVRVVFATGDIQPDGNIDQNDVQAGDKVQLIGRLLWRPARCEPPAQPVVTTAGTDTTNTETTNTETTNTDTTNTGATPTLTVTTIEPVIRKVIFKGPGDGNEAGAQRDAHTRSTETETETTTTSTETLPTTTVVP